MRLLDFEHTPSEDEVRYAVPSYLNQFSDFVAIDHGVRNGNPYLVVFVMPGHDTLWELYPEQDDDIALYFAPFDPEFDPSRVETFNSVKDQLIAEMNSHLGSTPPLKWLRDILVYQTCEENEVEGLRLQPNGTYIERQELMTERFGNFTPERGAAAVMYHHRVHNNGDELSVDEALGLLTNSMKSALEQRLSDGS